MCRRYDNVIGGEAYPTLYRAMRLPASNFPPRYNIAPTDQVPIVRVDPRDGQRELVMARWGLIPFWMKERSRRCRRREGLRVQEALARCLEMLRCRPHRNEPRVPAAASVFSAASNKKVCEKRAAQKHAPFRLVRSVQRDCR